MGCCCNPNVIKKAVSSFLFLHNKHWERDRQFLIVPCCFLLAKTAFFLFFTHSHSISLSPPLLYSLSYPRLLSSALFLCTLSADCDGYIQKQDKKGTNSLENGAKNLGKQKRDENVPNNKWFISQLLWCFLYKA